MVRITPYGLPRMEEEKRMFFKRDPPEMECCKWNVVIIDIKSPILAGDKSPHLIPVREMSRSSILAILVTWTAIWAKALEDDVLLVLLVDGSCCVRAKLVLPWSLDMDEMANEKDKRPVVYGSGCEESNAVSCGGRRSGAVLWSCFWRDCLALDAIW